MKKLITQTNPLNSCKKQLKGLFLLLVVLMFAFNANAQVALYSYTNNGVQTYTPITGGTVWQTGAAVSTNALSGQISFGGGDQFYFNGKNYSSVNISNNGYIVFGAQAPSLTNYTIISQTSNSGTLTNGYEGAIAGFSGNLLASAGSPEIRYEKTGGVFVIQFRDMARSLQTTDRINFQIRLTMNSGTVNLHYGTCVAAASTTIQPQVGLRGASHFDWKNLNGTTATTWTTPTNGNSVGTANSTLTMRYTSGAPAAVPSGNSFTFTSPAALGAPTYATIPVTQNFDAAPWANGVGTEQLPNSANWRSWPLYGPRSWRRHDVATATAAWESNSGAVTVASPASGGVARFHIYDATAGAPGYMDFHVNFSTPGPKTLTFDQLNVDGTDAINVFFSTDGGATFGSSLGTFGVAATWTGRSIDLGTSTSSTAVIRIQGAGDWGNSDMAIDNLAITLVSCAPPTTLVVTPTLNSASATWAAGPYGTPINYVWEVRTSGLPGSGPVGLVTSGSGATASASVTGLAGSTNFTLYVRSECAPGADFSSWGSAAFSTLPCIPATTNGISAGDLISRFRIIGSTLDNNTGFATSPNIQYTNFVSPPLNLTANLAAGTTYTVEVSTGEWGSQGLAVWIDYNDNGTFETTERVGFTPGQIGSGYTPGAVNATAQFPITLACNPPVGAHRLRVRTLYANNGSTLNPCTTPGGTTYGETEDYTVTVLPAPPCPNPSAGVISNPSFTGGTIDWTIGCVETQWDFHIVTAGSSAPLPGNAGNRPDITAKPYNFGSLTPGTAYDVYYRADCGGGNNSSWIGPVSITTACLLTLPVTQNFNTPAAAGIMPTCYSQQQVVNTGNLQVVASSSNPTTAPYEGGGYLLWNGYSITGGSETRLLTPAIVTTGTASVDVNFKWFSDNTAYVGGTYVDEGVFVEWSTSPSGPWNVVLPQITRNSTPAANGWKEVAVTLPAGAANQAAVYVSLRFLSRFGNNCSLDNLVIAPTPTCFPPTNLTATLVSGGSSTLSWTAPSIGAPSNYNWEVRTSGAGGSGATGLVASGSTATLTAVATGLNPIVNYTLWLKTDCVLPDVSTWASAPMPGPCVSGTNTFITVTPTCNNSFAEVATTQQAGQYIVVNVTNGTGYFFRSSNTNDWITLTNNTTNSVLAFSSGGGTLPWLATFTGAVRMYINTPNCGSQAIARTTSIRCGSPLNNDVAVEQIITLGRLPKTPISTTHVVRARITNLGFAPQTKTVTLAVAGSNTFTNTQSITLAPGASGVVTFAGYALNTAGTNTLTVSVPSDNNNANNNRTFTQTVTNAIVGFAGPSETVIPTGVGFNGTEGYFVAKLNSQTAQNINEVKVFFEFTGRDFRYGIWAADGPGGTPGTNLFLSGALTTNAGPAFLPVSPAVAVNGDYFVGIDQSSTVNVGFRYVAESPLRSGVFYSSTYGTLVSPWVDFSVSGNSNFKLAIEVQYQQNTPPECAVITPVPSQCQTDPTDVILNWASGGGAPTAFDLYYGTVPNPPLFQSNLTATTWNLGPANLLGPGTKYWRVVPKNAFGTATCPTVSNFAVNNLGCVCIPTYTFGKTSGDLISRVQILGTTLDNNSGVTAVNPAYTVFTGQANYTASLTASQTYTVRATIGSYANQGVAAWLDANEDGVFAPSEKIGFVTDIGTSFGSADFPIVIPCNPTPGIKRLRVRCVWITSGATIDPCLNYSFGEAEDYDVNILPPPPCPVPTSGILNSATPTTANIGWTAGCTETEWDVYVALASAPAPGLLTPATYPSQNTNTLNITGLTAATNYVFYVRSNCNLFTQSAWAGPYTFRTALVNDNIDGAIAINPALQANFITIDNTYALNGTPPTPNTSALGNRDMWYKATVPASGVIAITTIDAIPADPNMGDSYIQAWTTSDDTPTGTPTVLGINDDGGLGAHSHLYLSGLTPGKVVYIQVRAYSNTYFGKLRLAVNQAVQWTGATDQSYAGANWYRDAAPAATERMYIPTTINQPVVAANSTVAGIYMSSTSKIGINTGITLSNTGDVENVNGATGRSAIYGLGNLVQTNTVARNVIGNVGVQNLTINGSGGLTINAAASLWAYGTITPTLGTLTTNAKLTLANPQFSLAPYTTREGQIAGGAGTISGDVTVQRYIAKNGYHFISNPTSAGLTTNATWGSSFQVAGPFNYVYSADPNAPQPNPFPTIWTIDETVTNTSFVNGWVSGSQQAATSGRGFVASIPTARMTSVVGPVSNGSVSVNVSFTDDGYNLIGNPFPGGLAVNNTVTPANGFLSNPANAAVIAGGMWIWNPNVNNYSSVNASGVWTNAPSGTVLGQGRVPHTQSFIVYKTAPGVASVSFTPSMRNTTSVQNFLSTPAVARLQVSNFGRTDEAVVYVDANATDEFDSNLDAFKFMSNVDPSIPYIFTKNTSNQNLSINTYGSINESMIIPVGVYVGTEGNATITATDLEAFSGFSAVYLEDKVAGKLINLKETPSYTVKLSEGNSGDRFQLRFTNISENNANVSTSNQLNIFASDSRVFVNIPQEGNSRIEVMNILGQNLVTVDATSFKGLKEVSIPNVVAGSYLVKVTNGGKVYTQKVVLTNKQ